MIDKAEEQRKEDEIRKEEEQRLEKNKEASQALEVNSVREMAINLNVLRSRHENALDGDVVSSSADEKLSDLVEDGDLRGSATKLTQGFGAQPVDVRNVKISLEENRGGNIVQPSTVNRKSKLKTLLLFGVLAAAVAANKKKKKSQEDELEQNKKDQELDQKEQKYIEAFQKKMEKITESFNEHKNELSANINLKDILSRKIEPEISSSPVANLDVLKEMQTKDINLSALPKLVPKFDPPQSL